MTYEFDAPRSLVFQAWTKPELMCRWMGPPDGSMSIRELDLKVGGGYRFVWRGADGAETGERGVYREIVPPERIVSADAFDDWYPGEALVTTTFVEQGGSTTVTTTVLYPSNAVRNTVLKSDLETALVACYRKLTELLVSLT